MVFVIGKKSKISNIFAKNFIGKTPVFLLFSTPNTWRIQALPFRRKFPVKSFDFRKIFEFTD